MVEQTLALFRDQLWQFIGVILTVLALGLTIRQRQIKAISYDIITTNELLTVHEELEGKLQILYEGQPTKDISLVIIKLFNSGNLPIATSDYESPISFYFDDATKIISAAIIDVEPASLAVDVTTNSENIVLSPVLLNPEDSITIKLLLNDFWGRIKTGGRIIGVKSIKKAKERSFYHTLLRLIGIIMTIGGVYAVFKYMPRQNPEPPISIEMKLGFYSVIAGYALIALSFTRKLEYYKRNLKEFINFLKTRKSDEKS